MARAAAGVEHVHMRVIFQREHESFVLRDLERADIVNSELGHRIASGAK